MKRRQYEVNFRNGQKVEAIGDKSELQFENGKIKRLIIKIMEEKRREMLIFPFEKVEAYKCKLTNQEDYIVEEGAEEWTIRNF